MSHLRSLRDELFKYRKRKNRSIDGSVSGVPHERYRRFTTPQLGNRPVGSGISHHEDYLGNVPSQYRPSIFSPSVDWDEYDMNDQFGVHVQPPQQPKLFMPFPDIPDHSDRQEQFDYDRAKQASEILMEIMSQSYHHGSAHALDQPFEIDPVAAPLEDSLQNSWNKIGHEEEFTQSNTGDIARALWALEDKLPHDHPDIINLRQAMVERGRRDLSELQQNPEFQEVLYSEDDWQSNLGPTGNPYENDDEIQPEPSMMIESEGPRRDITELSDVLEHPYYEEQPVFQEMHELQQPEFIEEASEGMDFQEVSQEPVLEEMVEREFMAMEVQQAGMDMMPEAAPDPEMQQFDQGQPEQFMGYEVFDTNPAFDEINQAMDQAAAFEEPEMDPWKQQQETYQQMSQMMDQQMQYMANPFQMPDAMGPGYGPMMGPM